MRQASISPVVATRRTPARTPHALTADPPAPRPPEATPAADSRRLALGLFALLLVLGAADFALTALLLGPWDSVLGESNLLAGWVLHRAGWWGLAALKALSLLTVGAVCLVLHRRRPVLVPRVLGAACLITAGVLLYSLGMYRGIHEVQANREHWEANRERERALQRRQEQNDVYLPRIRELANQVREGRMGLGEAVDALQGAAEQARDPAWHDRLRGQFPPLQDPEELLAANVVKHALVGFEPGPRRDAAREPLARQFLALYRKPLPAEPARENPAWLPGPPPRGRPPIRAVGAATSELLPVQ